MLDNLPVQYRKDPWIMALAAAVEAKLAGQRGETDALPRQISLDTVTWNLPVEERVAGISPPAGATLDQRRTAVKAKWRSSGKATLEQIQMVADSWRNGAVEVDFTGGKIVVQFVGPFGIPEDLDSLKDALALVIPAHLALEFLFRYLLIRDLHQVKTLAEMERLTLNQFAGGSM